jgi:hypothetical protein
MMSESETWLTEDQVVDSVAAHLQKTGWEITGTCNTTQRGIDILAMRNGATLAVEAKGGGSSNLRSSRYGEPFTMGQKKVNVAMAVFAAMSEQRQAAIAFPDEVGYRRLIEKIRLSLQRLNIGVYFVALDKSVKLEAGEPSPN